MLPLPLCVSHPHASSPLRDRDPYTFDLPSLPAGQTSTVKMYDSILHNLVFANYYSLSSVDNDDGSNYYKLEGNVQLYGDGGLKNDFEGHDGHGTDNLYAFVGYGASNGYGDIIGTPGKAPYQLPDHVDSFVGNTVYMKQENPWGYANVICTGSAKTIISNNTVYTPSGNINMCGMPFAQWQGQGNDVATTVSPASAADAGVFTALARSLLARGVPAFATQAAEWRRV